MKAAALHGSGRRQSGLTMIEVLITLLIVSFGLLGVGALQLMSLQVNQGANQRTQAAILASSVIDSMKGNRGHATAYRREYGDAAPSGTEVAKLDMAAFLAQAKSVLPLGDIEVTVTPTPSANAKVFFDVVVNVRWSEAGRRLDTNDEEPASYTEFQMQTNV